MESTEKALKLNNYSCRTAINMKFGSMCGISTASIMTSRIQKTLQSKYFKFYSLSQTDVRTITILHLSTLIIKNGKFADKEVESSTVVPGFSVLGFRALP